MLSADLVQYLPHSFFVLIFHPWWLVGQKVVLPNNFPLLQLEVVFYTFCWTRLFKRELLKFHSSFLGFYCYLVVQLGCMSSPVEFDQSLSLQSPKRHREVQDCVYNTPFVLLYSSTSHKPPLRFHDSDAYKLNAGCSSLMLKLIITQFLQPCLFSCCDKHLKWSYPAYISFFFKFTWLKVGKFS